MSKAEAKRGIPLNPNASTDATLFTPVYDVEVARRGRKFNIGLAVVLGAIIFAATFSLTLQLFPYDPHYDRENQGELIKAVLGQFALPIIAVFAGFVFGQVFAARLGFDVEGAIDATKESLQAWLPESTGPWDKPPKDAEAFFMNLMDGEDNRGEESLHLAAKSVTLGSTEPILLRNSKGESIQLVWADSGYRLQL